MNFIKALKIRKAKNIRFEKIHLKCIKAHQNIIWRLCVFHFRTKIKHGYTI